MYIACFCSFWSFHIRSSYLQDDLKRTGHYIPPFIWKWLDNLDEILSHVWISWKCASCTWQVRDVTACALKLRHITSFSRTPTPKWRDSDAIRSSSDLSAGRSGTRCSTGQFWNVQFSSLLITHYQFCRLPRSAIVYWYKWVQYDLKRQLKKSAKFAICLRQHDKHIMARICTTKNFRICPSCRI